MSYFCTGLSLGLQARPLKRLFKEKTEKLELIFYFSVVKVSWSNLEQKQKVIRYEVNFVRNKKHYGKCCEKRSSVNSMILLILERLVEQ